MLTGHGCVWYLKFGLVNVHGFGSKLDVTLKEDLKQRSSNRILDHR